MNQAELYTTTEAYSGTAYADPHSLITKMFDGALKCIAQAKGAIMRHETAAKGEQISRAINIIGSLDACLDHDKGGELSANLSSLYDYMNLRLAEANINDDLSKLDEVSGLISEIRSGWVQIPQQLEAKAG